MSPEFCHPILSTFSFYSSLQALRTSERELQSAISRVEKTERRKLHAHLGWSKGVEEKSIQLQQNNRSCSYSMGCHSKLAECKFFCEKYLPSMSNPALQVFAASRHEISTNLLKHLQKSDQFKNALPFNYFHFNHFVSIPYTQSCGTQNNSASKTK